VVHIFDIVVPIKIQLVAIKDKHIFQSRDMDLQLDFTSNAPITQEEIEQVEFSLQGKPITYESALLKYIEKLAEECLQEVKPLLDTLYTVNPDHPKMEAKVVLNGKITWKERLPDTRNADDHQDVPPEPAPPPGPRAGRLGAPDRARPGHANELYRHGAAPEG
jgi:hypothetical protein